MVDWQLLAERQVDHKTGALTLDELGSFGALQSLEEQNEDLFPVLSERLSGKVKKNMLWLKLS